MVAAPKLREAVSCMTQLHSALPEAWRKDASAGWAMLSAASKYLARLARSQLFMKSSHVLVQSDRSCAAVNQRHRSAAAP